MCGLFLEKFNLIIIVTRFPRENTTYGTNLEQMNNCQEEIKSQHYIYERERERVTTGNQFQHFSTNFFSFLSPASDLDFSQNKIFPRTISTKKKNFLK